MTEYGRDGLGQKYVLGGEDLHQEVNGLHEPAALWGRERAGHGGRIDSPFSLILVYFFVAFASSFG